MVFILIGSLGYILSSVKIMFSNYKRIQTWGLEKIQKKFWVEYWLNSIVTALSQPGGTDLSIRFGVGDRLRNKLIEGVRFRDKFRIRIKMG